METASLETEICTWMSHGRSMVRDANRWSVYDPHRTNIWPICDQYPTSKIVEEINIDQIGWWKTWKPWEVARNTMEHLLERGSPPLLCMLYLLCRYIHTIFEYIYILDIIIYIHESMYAIMCIFVWCKPYVILIYNFVCYVRVSVCVCILCACVCAFMCIDRCIYLSMYIYKYMPHPGLPGRGLTLIQNNVVDLP